jgi:uncharacterized RDD family membrane protein YckC
MNEQRPRELTAFGIFGGAVMAFVGLLLPWERLELHGPTSLPSPLSFPPISHGGLDTGTGDLIFLALLALVISGRLLVTQDRAKGWVVSSAVALTVLGAYGLAEAIADREHSGFVVVTIGPGAVVVVAAGVLVTVTALLCGRRRPLRPAARPASAAEADGSGVGIVDAGASAGPVAVRVRTGTVQVGDGERVRGGIFRRIGAELVDGLLFLPIPALFLVVNGIHVHERYWGLPGSYRVVSVVVSTIYNIVAVAVWGTTVGKRVTKVEVVDRDTGARPSWRSATIRAAVPVTTSIPYVGPVLGIVILLPAVWRPDQRAWHDQLAGTVVVRRE